MYHWLRVDVQIDGPMVSSAAIKIVFLFCKYVHGICIFQMHWVVRRKLEDLASSFSSL